MPGDRVDRLDLAAVALGRPGVDQAALDRHPRGTVGVEHLQVAGVGVEVAGLGVGVDRAGLHRPALVYPRGPAAVEDGDGAVAGVPQQPPGAGRGGATDGVVHHHRPVVADPAAPHRRLEPVEVRERVPAAGAVGRTGQVGAEVHVDRARQVPGEELLVAVGAAELVAHVEQGHRGRVEVARVGQHHANGSGSPIIDTACARDAVSRRRWCWRQSTS